MKPVLLSSCPDLWMGGHSLSAGGLSSADLFLFSSTANRGSGSSCKVGMGRSRAVPELVPFTERETESQPISLRVMTTIQISLLPHLSLSTKPVLKKQKLMLTRSFSWRLISGTKPLITSAKSLFTQVFQMAQCSLFLDFVLCNLSGWQSHLNPFSLEVTFPSPARLPTDRGNLEGKDQALRCPASTQGLTQSIVSSKQFGSARFLRHRRC